MLQGGKCSLNHANHCPDCCTTNDQRMGLALWKRLYKNWILVLNDISNPEITRFELVMTTHYTNSDSPAVVPQVQEEVTHA